MRFREYIQDRDKDRSKRGDAAFWQDNSLTFTARVFQLCKVPVHSGLSNVASSTTNTGMVVIVRKMTHYRRPTGPLWDNAFSANSRTPRNTHLHAALTNSW
jgi:hypothetical protein